VIELAKKARKSVLEGIAGAKMKANVAVNEDDMWKKWEKEDRGNIEVCSWR